RLMLMLPTPSYLPGDYLDDTTQSYIFCTFQGRDGHPSEPMKMEYTSARSAATRTATASQPAIFIFTPSTKSPMTLRLPDRRTSSTTRTGAINQFTTCE